MNSKLFIFIFWINSLPCRILNRRLSAWQTDDLPMIQLACLLVCYLWSKITYFYDLFDRPCTSSIQIMNCMKSNLYSQVIFIIIFEMAGHSAPGGYGFNQTSANTSNRFVIHLKFADSSIIRVWTYWKLPEVFDIRLTQIPTF